MGESHREEERPLLLHSHAASCGEEALMIIAIDGPAGSGKSTVAKCVARELGFHYLDTGAMYRAVAWAALDASLDAAAPDDAEAIAAIARDRPIAFAHEPRNPIATSVSIGGRDCTREIRTPEVDRAVSAVSALPSVRESLVYRQREIASTDDIVVEGRDIGTVVFPDAPLKVFVTASPEERARRRAAQNFERGVGETDAGVILTDIIARDEADSTRDVSPLCAAPDAVEIDTTEMDVDSVTATICELARGRGMGV